jgi:aminoglycoside phosphotransferase (APT) family kinase protein
MCPPDIKELAERIVPGRGAAQARHLSTGLFNHTYRVVRDDAVYALRVAAEPAPWPQDRAWEIRVLMLAGQAGLAPPLLYADADLGVLLLRFVAGTPWSAAAARRRHSLARVADLMHAIHALPIPSPPREMHPAAWIDCYTRALGREGTGRARAFAPAAGAKLTRLERLPGASRALCHSDLHRLNLLQCESRAVLLLDWEYAHVADPYWDLAGWSANNDLPDELQRALLEAYAGAPAGAAQWTRFKLLYWLYDYICLLWIELYARWRPADAALARRAARLETRLAAAEPV